MCVHCASIGSGTSQHRPARPSINANGSAQLSVSDNGTLVHVSGSTISSAAPMYWLDASGKTINSQTATVGPVSAGQSGRFSVTGTGAGIAAFRYTPLVDPATIKPKG